MTLADRLPPTPALAALVAVLGLGPVGFVVLGTGHRTAPHARADATLASVARAGGCRLTEYATLRPTNPTTGGRVVNERIQADPGSYVGRPAPSARGALHALMHGAILVEYRPDVGAAEQQRLATLAAPRATRTLVFENRAGMRPRVAATAYLSMLTCPGAGDGALRALRAFRDRRTGFGQGF